jgi:molybdate transport system substrate-binding protein
MANKSLSRRRLLAALACLAGAAASGPALALDGELSMACEPSLKGVLAAALKQFEKEAGLHVVLQIVKPSQLASVLKGANPPHLVVLPQEQVDKLVQAGQLAADSRRPFGRAGLALVVRSGATPPDVSTPQALKRVLESAPSIAYPDPSESSAGSQAAHVIERLGLSDALRGKTTLGSGANPLASVRLGAAEVGLQARHEVLDAPGLALAGPLPAALQQWQAYGMALTSTASNLDEARRLIAFLASDAGRKMLEAGGIWPQG